MRGGGEKICLSQYLSFDLSCPQNCNLLHPILFGFSGNGRLDESMFRLLRVKDVKCYSESSSSYLGQHFALDILCSCAMDLMIPVLVIVHNCIAEQHALFATSVQNLPYQMKMFLTRGQLLGASEEGVTIR